MSSHDVAELLAAAAAAVPDGVAVVEGGGRRLTWSELEDEVARVASGLVAHGVVGGHRVLICVGNRLEFVTAYLAVLRAQAVAVPVNPRAGTDELARMVADSGSRLAIVESTSAPALRGAVALLARVVAGEATDLDEDLVPRAVVPRLVLVGAPPEPDELAYDDLRATAPVAVPPLLDPEKLAALLYTSGTSGRPRAAMLTHRALLANLAQVAAVEPPLVHSGDVVLGVLPLFHVYGLNAVLGSVLWHRARLVLAEGFDPEGTLDLVEDEACSVVPVAPPVFDHWLPRRDLRERLGPVRLVLSGSAPLAGDVIDRFTALTGVPVHQGYGLTEASPVVTSTLRSAAPRSGSLGAPLAGVELRLVDELTHLAEGEDPGEIQIRGANLFSGYWPDGSGGPDAEGWWSTGDVGYLDPAGDLVLVDRVQELVVVSGFNVYPREVENVIREVAGVAETAVIGVPDPQGGQAVVAYVVARGGHAEEAAGLAEAVRAHCAARLAAFKRPGRIEVTDRLPMTITGRVQKGRLRLLERRRALGLIE